MAARPFFAAAVGTAVDVNSSTFARLHAIKAVNKNAAVAYVQFFNVPAASVVLGTTVPVWQIPLIASENLVMQIDGTPVHLGGGGISVAVTTLPAGSVAGSADLAILHS